MPRYIDEQLLMEKISRMIDYCEKNKKVNGLTALFSVGDAVMDCPTADVVEVVRCRDCAVPHNFWTGCPHLNGLIPPPNFYCAYGERKTDENRH